MAKNIIFRKATIEDLSNIMDIISQAQVFLKENDINQWQNNYPNKEVILNDIKNRNSYILVSDNVVVGTTAVIFEKENTYDNIYKGHWMSDENYSTIHRIAINNEYKGTGFASLLMEKITQLSKDHNVGSIRVDTHVDNTVMKNFLLKNGFQYCGIIYLIDGNERLAYEKILP